MSLRNPDPTQKPPLGSYIDWSHPLAEGLVGCWISNQDDGIILNDLCPNAINGKLLNGATFKNGCVNFDGVDDLVSIDSVLANSGDFSVVVKVRQTALQPVVNAGNHAGIVSRMDGINNSWSFAFGDFAGRPWRFAVRDIGGIYHGFNGSASDTNEHMASAICKVGKYMQIWVDGRLDAENTTYVPTEVYPSSSLLRFARHWDGANPENWLNGSIYLVYLYIKALNAQKNEWLNAEPFAFTVWPCHRVFVDFGAVTIFLSETGAGVDALSNLSAEVPAEDTGLGVDTVAISAEINAQDAGAGTDDVVIEVTLPTLLDFGSGADVVSASNLIRILDSAIGEDAATVAVDVSLQDQGQGMEALSVDALVGLLEETFGTDAITVIGSEDNLIIEVRMSANVPSATITVRKPGARFKLIN